VHRRFGIEARRLEPTEMAAWAQRLYSIANTMYMRQEKPVPIYFLWGTDHRNVPLMNKKSLQQALMLKEGLRVLEWEPASVLTMMKKSHVSIYNSNIASVAMRHDDDTILKDDKDQKKSASKRSSRPSTGGIKRYFSSINNDK
jgi:hypothetical protein